MTATMLLADDTELRDEEPEAPPEPPLPDKFEVVDGRIVEIPSMSAYAAGVANRLNRAVLSYLDRHDIGEPVIELLFHIPQPDDAGRNRQPDWAFVTYDRWPKDSPWSYRGNARDVVPDLAAEVVSPGDHADDLLDDLLAKVREYLRGGVRLVWVVYPLAREVHAYMPGANQVRVHFAADDLDAPDILPGFRTPVAALFPPTEPPPPAPPAA